MQVPSIRTGLASLLPNAGPPDTAGPAAIVDGSDATTARSPAADARLREIVSQYDFEHISPREFSHLLQELQASGVMRPQELQELAQLRIQLDAQQADPDAPLNLLDYLSDQLTARQQAVAAAQANGEDVDEQAVLADVRRQSAWIQKFQAIVAQGPAGLDLSA